MNRKFDLPARLARRSARRMGVLLRFHKLSFGKTPILFANSFPKSGTHLLTQIMQGFSCLGLAVDSGLPAVVTFDGFSGRQRSDGEILDDLQRLLPGDIAYGHVHAFPKAVDLLCQDAYAAYFILRDPRDVVVSHVHYIAEMAPNHIHHRYYHEVLHSFDERLEASICGVSITELERASGMPVLEPLPDIATRFTPYLDWLAHPEILTLRYEEFFTDREIFLGKIFDQAVRRGFSSQRSQGEAIHLLENNINPQRSPTFRSGKVGGWRECFNENHKSLFAQISGDLMVRLGYEYQPKESPGK